MFYVGSYFIPDWGIVYCVPAHNNLPFGNPAILTEMKKGGKDIWRVDILQLLSLDPDIQFYSGLLSGLKEQGQRFGNRQIRDENMNN